MLIHLWLGTWWLNFLIWQACINTGSQAVVRKDQVALADFSLIFTFLFHRKNVSIHQGTQILEQEHKKF